MQSSVAWEDAVSLSVDVVVTERTGALSLKRQACTHLRTLCATLSLTTLCQLVQNWLHSCDAASDLYAPGTASERSGLNLQQQSRSHSDTVISVR